MTHRILAGRHVLVVDDERLVLQAVSRLLRRLGAAAIYEATSLDAALGTVVSSRVDLALIDLAIGHTSGLTVIAALRRAHPGLPVLLITGSADPEGLPDDVAVLHKPFLVADLADAIEGRIDPVTSSADERWVG